jgi:hypothetical protein
MENLDIKDDFFTMGIKNYLTKLLTVEKIDVFNQKYEIR